jgi:restriction endonuclease S subunit
LEGLEAIELKYSFVKSESKDFRIESEYFKKEYRILKDTLLAKPHELLLHFLKQPVQTGHTPSMQNPFFYGGEIKFIKTDNLRDNYIKPFYNHYLSIDGNNEIRRTFLEEKDIITTIIGATHDIVARSCIINKEILPANINQNIALIRVNKERISPEFLNIYLNTRYGKKYLHYLSRQMEQVNLNCREVEQLIVPILSNTFQSEIENKVIKAHIDKEKAKILYEQAETLLLETLNLKDFQLSKEPVNVKNFSESFGSSGRLDAEYYQVKYENYLEFIQSYSSGVELLNEICVVKDKNFNPSEKIEYKYIELANIGKSGEILGCTIDYGSELPTRARRKVNTNDVIISSIEGSLESCALVTKEYDNALCSTGFYVVKSEKLNPETLLVLFKSEPIQALLKKGCSGTILTAISKTELERIPLPLIDTKTQNKIKEQINKSFELKNQSEHLLEVAKTAVEIAIEQDEETAIEFINNQIS